MKMKSFIAKLVVATLLLSATVALADGYDWAYKQVSEFPTTTTAPTSSDKKCLFVAADNKVECYAGNVEKLAGTFAGAATGTFDGTVGATTPSTGAFTSLTTTLGVVHTRTPAADSGATNNASKVALTTPIDTTGTNTHNAYDVALTVSNATGGTNTINGWKFENYTGDAQDNVNAINIGTSDGLGTANAIVIGTGWDAGVVNDSGMKLGSTNGTLVTSLIVASDAVANGQTSKTTTMTGITSSSKCVATVSANPTNSVFLKSAAPGTNQIVVTASGDPGAATLAYTVICLN